MKDAKAIFNPSASYAGCMDQILDRIRLLIDILDNGKTLGNESFDYEIVALNFRKILELVAYSSLLGHHKKYIEAYKNAEKHYKAKSILNEIEKLNPKFYPAPVTIKASAGDRNNPHMIETRQVDYLTREEFIILYDKCSDIMHVRNILREDQHIDFVHKPQYWLKKSPIYLTII